MKLHTTNYYNTFIVVADDSPVGKGEIPPQKADAPSIAQIQFELIAGNPYKYTSDDVLFRVFARRNGLSPGEYKGAREQLFSRGQACLRASPLAKRYGWGIHCDAEGKVALYGVGSEEYSKYLNDERLAKIKAMRSRRV